MEMGLPLYKKNKYKTIIKRSTNYIFDLLYYCITISYNI